MRLIDTPLEGAFIIENFKHGDDRGLFVKPFHAKLFAEAGLQTQWAESFFSTNRYGVIRGMHFQTGADAHEKLVYAVQGTILDVVVDLRPESASFKHWFGVELTPDNGRSVYIPKGCAHGFCASEPGGGTIVYMTSTVHAPASDKGIRYDSFGLEWPVSAPVMSLRDEAFPSLEEYLALYERP